MSVDTQQIYSNQPAYYVINMHNDQWVKISKSFFNLEDAKNAYSELLKEYPFARLGGKVWQEN